MCGYLALFSLFLLGSCLSLEIQEDKTVLAWGFEVMGPYFLQISKLPRNCEPEKYSCFLTDIQHKQLDNHDENKDGSLSKDEMTKMMEHMIEIYFDTLDNNDDGELQLSLQDILFKIKTDFLKPIINEYWSYLGDDYNIKPSDLWFDMFGNSLEKDFKDFFDGPIKEVIDLLDNNNDGQFNKQEITDATIAIIKLIDDNTDGIVTLDEITKYANETGMLSESKLDNAQRTIKSTVKSLNDELFTPIMAQVDKNKDNMISKTEAMDILNLNIENTTSIFYNTDTNFDHFHEEFKNLDDFLDDKQTDTPQKVYELAQNTVEDLKTILEHSKGFENGSDGRSSYFYKIVGLIITYIINYLFKKM